MEKGSAVKVASLAPVPLYASSDSLSFYRVLDTWERSLNMNQHEAYFDAVYGF